MKIRVDDQLDRTTKMSPDIYGTVISASREFNTPVASHMVTQEDAKELLRRGTGLRAHSVRDRPVDEELISLMREREVCITPTLTRELSVFVHARRPDFFDDPFFLKYTDPDVLEELQKPEIQQRYTGPSTDYYREALPVSIPELWSPEIWRIFWFWIRILWRIFATCDPSKLCTSGGSRLKGFRGDYYKLSMKRQHLFFRVARTFFTI